MSQKIEIAKLYSRTKFDGTPTLSGRMGAARLRIEPNPTHDPDDPKSADWLAFIEEAPAPQPSAQPYRGPSLPTPPRPVSPPRRAPALQQSHDPFSDHYIEGEVVS